MLLQVFTRGQRGEEGARTRGGALGLGLLMGAATFSFGVERGCRKAEILAINGAGLLACSGVCGWLICWCEGKGQP